MSRAPQHAGRAYAREELELPLLKVAGMRSVHSSATDGAARAAPSSVFAGFFDCGSGGASGSAEGARARVVAVASEYRMLEATADEEKAFHFANRVLASSTVRPAEIPRRALNAKAVCSRPPPLNPTSRVVTCCDQNPRRVQEGLSARINKNQSIW